MRARVGAAAAVDARAPCVDARASALLQRASMLLLTTAAASCGLSS